MKKSRKRLALNSETVRSLNQEQSLDEAALRELRGATFYTGYISCVTCYEYSRCRPCYV